MLARLFPPHLTNAYDGSGIALWLFIPVLIAKTLMAINFSGLNPLMDLRDVLEGVDGVPLSTFSPGAVAAVVDSAAAWGVALLTLCLFAWLVVFRYRGALPLAILLLLVEQVGRTGTDLCRAVLTAVTGAAPLTVAAMINLGLTILLFFALVLALAPRRKADIGSTSD